MTKAKPQNSKAAKPAKKTPTRAKEEIKIPLKPKPQASTKAPEIKVPTRTIETIPMSKRPLADTAQGKAVEKALKDVSKDTTLKALTVKLSASKLARFKMYTSFHQKFQSEIIEELIDKWMEENKPSKI